MSDYTERNNSRMSKSVSTDKRTKKTKQALENALFELIKDKDLNSISVTELSRKAQINRSTFYFYYEDIYDMMEQIQNEIYDVFERDIAVTSLKFDKSDDYMKYLCSILEFCIENADMIRFVITNDCNQKLQHKIMKVLLENLPDSTAVFNEKDPRYYLTTFAVNAIKGTILRWLDDGMKVPPKEMALFLAMTYVTGSVKTKNTDITRLTISK